MTPLIKLMENPLMMWLCGIVGDSLCTVGIVSAVTDKEVAGFKPTTWILLAMVFYMYFIISILARILATLVEQGELQA